MMSAAARREAINRLVAELGKVSVRELADRFDVSVVTIRSDLTALERRGVMRRVRGGAVHTSIVDEGSFSYRLVDSAKAKLDIAKRAARLVHNGDSLCLDSSTTAYYLAQNLLVVRDLLVVTHSFSIASLLMEHSSATVFFVGGVLRRSSQSSSVVRALGGLTGSVELGFFGGAGVSIEHGLAEWSLEEAESKRTLASHCRHVHAIVDSSKFDARATYPWMDATAVASVVTDAAAPLAAVAAWRSRGVHVDIGVLPRSAAGGARG